MEIYYCRNNVEIHTNKGANSYQLNFENREFAPFEYVNYRYRIKLISLANCTFVTRCDISEKHNIVLISLIFFHNDITYHSALLEHVTVTLEVVTGRAW